MSNNLAFSIHVKRLQYFKSSRFKNNNGKKLLERNKNLCVRFLTTFIVKIINENSVP